MMDLGVEGIDCSSPGYSYDKAPDQNHFLGRTKTRDLFRKIPLQPQRSVGPSTKALSS